MITTITLQNFKCFNESSTFEFSKYNLLTGINGRGKSSLLQSLLLLSQSASKNNNFQFLFINGDLINLGNYDDIRNSFSPRNESVKLRVDIHSPTINGSLDLHYNEFIDDPLLAALKNYSYGSLELPKVVDFFKNLHFISADRLGPVPYVEKSYMPRPIKVGSRGEFTINALAMDILPLVNEKLYLGQDSITVIQQTQEWLSYILDGAKISIKGKEKESTVLSLLLNNRPNSYNYKPMNIGFGYSYILPLIVTGLIAQPDDIIIIENPEAHLHPQAQSRLAEFFSKVASCGIQVFMESHSEHILNGMRISALRDEININTEELSIYYFDESFNAEKMNIEKNGKITNWPLGFFDQQETDLAEIFRLGKMK